MADEETKDETTEPVEAEAAAPEAPEEPVAAEPEAAEPEAAEPEAAEPEAAEPVAAEPQAADADAETAEAEAVEEPAVEEPAAAEEPAAEEAAEEPAAEVEEAAEEAAAEEPAAEAEEAAPPAVSGPKKKRKRLPRSERHKHSKPERKPEKDRKPIVRLPKPDSELGRRQERRGVVVSDKGDKSIVVKVEMIRAHPKYKKVVRKSNKLHAHDEQNTAGIGDIVRIVETRPLSKTKRWRLAEIVEKAK
jgi:small subunit ribosomal protein S17